MPEEKKSTYKGFTDARKKANEKYLRETVEDIRIRVPKGEKAKIQAHATSTGESVNSFVVRAIKGEMSAVVLPLSKSITHNDVIQNDLEAALKRYGSSCMTGYSRESCTDGRANLILKFKSKDHISDEVIRDFISILNDHNIDVLSDQE